ncbi:O-antigen ligase family protein [Actinomyces sp. B33]|uniref:O-antigen ligase family protein n=1 Tax=Actinomyces sp. B33 TaxID=2942131 RepID=UPI002342862C|nr:O-antigen ligase family protein [Actinomyces sp. B33]MDC4233630.1 O-antigen ligase family protein [Actinomyces sp. B33]
MKDLDPLELARLLTGRREDGPDAARLTRADRGLLVRALPAWPFVLSFAGFLAAWALGIGDLIWPVAALLMVFSWAGATNLSLPPATALWGLFLLWATASLVMNDTAGRLIGALYRVVLYASAGVIYVHLHNARRRIPIRVVTSAMTWFLLSVTAGGFLGMAFPSLVLRTPMSWVVPGALASNDLVHDMVFRRTAQWNPEAWNQVAPRPSAPFLYANQWGNVYSLVLPLAVLNIVYARTLARRVATALVVLASFVPAAATQNRGMAIGLLVVLAWTGVQALRRGRAAPVIAGAAVLVLAALAWVVSPASEAFFHRLEASPSTTDRYELYRLTIESVLQSPLLGWGSPRPAGSAWLPSVGTQGQLWLLMQSHGFVGLGLFLAFFLVLAVRAARRTDACGAVAGGVIAATLVETVYYGMTSGLAVSMVAAALVARPEEELTRSHGPAPAPPGSRPPARTRAEERIERARGRTRRAAGEPLVRGGGRRSAALRGSGGDEGDRRP